MLANHSFAIVTMVLDGFIILTLLVLGGIAFFYHHAVVLIESRQREHAEEALKAFVVQANALVGDVERSYQNAIHAHVTDALREQNVHGERATRIAESMTDAIQADAHKRFHTLVQATNLITNANRQVSVSTFIPQSESQP